jgi:hypothetical protein
MVLKKKPKLRALPLSGAEPEYSWDPWGTTGRTHDNCYDYAFGSFSAKRTSKSVPGDRAGDLANGLTFRTCSGVLKRVLEDNPGTVYHMKNPNAKCRPGYYKVMCFVAPSNDFSNSTGDFHWYRQNSSIRYRIRGGDTVGGLAKFFRVKPDVIKRALLSKMKPLSLTNGMISNSNGDFRVLNKNNEMMIKSSLPIGSIIRFPVNLWSHKQGWASGPLLVDARGRTIVDPRKADRSYKPGFHYTTFCSAFGVKRGMVTTGS